MKEVTAWGSERMSTAPGSQGVCSEQGGGFRSGAPQLLTENTNSSSRDSSDEPATHLPVGSEPSRPRALGGFYHYTHFKDKHSEVERGLNSSLS